jgi:hypothetical protein
MFIRRIIASIAYILILISVVEGTCKCKEVCPNYTKKDPDCYGDSCSRVWVNARKKCYDYYYTCCPNGICQCNVFGCNCNGCANCGCEKCATNVCVKGCDADAPNNPNKNICDGREHIPFLTEEMDTEDTCEDYNFFMSLSLEEKTKFLGDKYCDDGFAADDIFKKLLTYVDSNLETNSINLDELELSCDDFNKSTSIGRKLKLCKNGNKKGHQKFNKYRKNKKEKNKNSKSE